MNKKRLRYFLYKKPQGLWELREYKNGSLLENGIALNKTATLIYKLCNGKETVNEIINIIWKKYMVDKRKVRNDVVNCIQELLNNGAIKLKCNRN
ncbi:MAG: PqqD family protein [Candidatus Aenigmatarchaeota archaeon]